MFYGVLWRILIKLETISIAVNTIILIKGAGMVLAHANTLPRLNAVICPITGIHK
jgi:hypothetical protein